MFLEKINKIPCSFVAITKATMKHDLLLTAKGHQGTQKRMEQEFALIKLWEAPDRAAALRDAAPRIRALAHTGHSKVDAALMDALPKLEIIANFGVGVDQIDLDAAKQRGIIVTNTANVLNACVADCAMALVLNTLRKFPQAEKYLRAGLWKTQGTYQLTTSLGGKTLGILGLGRIGEEIAKRGRAFGMNIRYHNRNKKDVPYAYDPDVVTLAKNSDVLLVITPGGAETDKLVDARVLDALGPQGYLVNVARGSVVDQPVLLQYLQQKKSPAPDSMCITTNPMCRRRFSNSTTRCCCRTWPAPPPKPAWRWAICRSKTSCCTSPAKQ